MLGGDIRRRVPSRELVCIGAGIGITPFHGKLAFELNNRDFRVIWFYYVTYWTR